MGRVGLDEEIWTHVKPPNMSPWIQEHSTNSSQ